MTEHQEQARSELRDVLGLTAIAEELSSHRRTVEIVDSEALDGYQRTRAVLGSEPNVEIPFWILRPARPGPFPVALLPHGHTHWGADQYVGLYRDESGRRKITEKRKDLAVQAVRRGFLAVAPATRGFEPVAPAVGGGSQKSCQVQAVHALLAGRTALGERLWDLSGILGWVLEMPEADPTRVLVAGHSGGGVLSTFLAAIDERVRVAAANESVCSFVCRDGRMLLCSCNVLPGLLRWGETADILALVAPRPFVALSGRLGLYPVDEVARVMDQASLAYQAAGASDNIVLHIEDEPCRVYEHALWSHVARFVPGVSDGTLVPSADDQHDPDGVGSNGDGDAPPTPTVSLRAVTPESVLALCRLELSPRQERFVKPAAVTIAQGLCNPRAWLRGIYADDEPVGVVLVLRDEPTAGHYYLWRFMIDRRFQGRGLGSRALTVLLAELAAIPKALRIFLKYVSEPGNARSFYARHGFVDAGLDGRDGVMERDLLPISADRTVR